MGLMRSKTLVLTMSLFAGAPFATRAGAETAASTRLGTAQSSPTAKETLAGIASILAEALPKAPSVDQEGAAEPILLPEMAVTKPAPVQLDYLVVRQDAAAFFEILARDTGQRLDLDPKVGGTLTGLRLTGTLDQVMEKAAAPLGLDWFAFNGVLYVSDQSAALTRLVRLGDLDPKRVIAVLDDSGFPTDRMAIKPSSDASALALSGPPKLLALAEAMIEGIPPERIADVAERRKITLRRGTDEETVQLP